MKFKNLITESIIDTLKLSKEEKAILKTFNIVDDDKNTYESGTFDLTDGEKIIKVSDMTGVNDLDKLYSLYKFFKKNKDILFKDEYGIEYGVLDIKDKDLLSALILKYFYDHFNETTLFKVYGGEWKLGAMFDLQDQIAEESYSIIINLDSDTLPNVVLYSGIFKDEDKGIGWDLITHDDDFAIFNAKNIKRGGRQYEEALDSGHINIPPPKNLSNSEMEKYFKELFMHVEDIILDDMWIIEEYMEYKNNN